MIDAIPMFYNLLAVAITFIVMFLFYKASNFSSKVLIISLVWLLVQGAITYSGFYTKITTPPRFVLLIVPVFAFLILLFFTKSGKAFIDGLNLKWLTSIHTIRIPVEFGLHTLFIYSLIPQIMTYEGFNFDIIMGITAILILLFGWSGGVPRKKMQLAWNFLGLILIFTIITISILSAQTPLQQFGFDQPNIAVLYFPYSWLPAYVVPIVVFSHLASIRKLLKLNT